MADADELLLEIQKQRRALGTIQLQLDALLDRAGIPHGDRPPPVQPTGQHAIIPATREGSDAPVTLGPEGFAMSYRAAGGAAWRVLRYFVTLAIGALGGAAGKRWWWGGQ